MKKAIILLFILISVFILPSSMSTVAVLDLEIMAPLTTEPPITAEITGDETDEETKTAPTTVETETLQETIAPTVTEKPEETQKDPQSEKPVKPEKDPQSEKPESTYNFTTDPTQYEEDLGESVNTDDNENTAFQLSGDLRTATGTSFNIIVDWKAERREGEDFVTLTLNASLEHKALESNSFPGVMTINGQTISFTSPEIQYKKSEPVRDPLCSFEGTVPLSGNESKHVNVSVKWDFVGKVEKRNYDGFTFEGNIPIGKKYSSLKPIVSFKMKNILQRPQLPEGCEVTSLAIVLNYLGFQVSHTHLADNYLEQGPAQKTDFYEKNVGNPRLKGQSWGCYSPVIVKTANKYLYAQESYYRAYNYTGYDISELYYQLSMGHPAIVWVTMDFAEPYLKSPWTVNGKTLWWKYPLHCLVISGYDFDKGTVTLTDPMKNDPVTIDIQTFELRYKQMESQAIVIKKSKPIEQ